MGGNNFKVVRQEITGNLFIIENSQYYHLNAQNVTVMENVKARLFGTAEELILKKGSEVVVHGKITGSIRNYGGNLQMYNQ